MVWSAFLKEQDPAYAIKELSSLDFVEEFDCAVVGLLGRRGFNEVAEVKDINMIMRIAKSRNSDMLAMIELARKGISDIKNLTH
jgi:hypothetical protein